jgi:ATP-dependent Zn protease
MTDEANQPPVPMDLGDTSAASNRDAVTAYHEAGHAVMALALGRPIHRVTIEPNHRFLGRCELGSGRFRPSDDVLEIEVLILLAGPVAEARHTGRFNPDAADHDLRGVRSLVASRGATWKQVERLERRFLDKTEHWFDRPGMWSAVEAIAAELLKTPTLSGRAARHHYEQAVTRAS